MVDKWRQLPVPEGYESKIDAVLNKLPEPIWGENIRAAHNGLNPLGQTTIVSPSPQDLIQAHEMRSLGKVATKTLFGSHAATTFCVVIISPSESRTPLIDPS